MKNAPLFSSVLTISDRKPALSTLGRTLSAVAVPLFLAAGFGFSATTAVAQDPPSTVVIDASRFLDNLPYEHEITSAPGGQWLFNNLALRATTRHNPIARVEIPAGGNYHVYVRSRGGRFRVAVDDQVIGENLEHDSMELRRVGMFELSQGESDVRAMGIDGSPEIDVIVLSTRDDLTEDDLLEYEYDPEVELLHDYSIPRNTSSVKFGDLTGDGRIDFLVVTNNFSAHAFDHDGNELWNWQAPGTRQHEAPGLVWDVNRNGRSEVIHWRLEDDQEWLVIADGPTGEILHRTEWPTQPLPHDWSNFRLAIAQFDSDYPDSILVFTDSGRYSERQGDISIAAFDSELQMLWRHDEDKWKDHLGHYIYPIDLTGDGVDEVVASALVLDSEGNEIWNRFDYHFRNQEHMDSIHFADITGDGELEIVAACSDMGVQVFNALTGELIWQRNAEHTQQIEIGDFLASDVRRPHIAVGARTYNPLSSQVWWFSPDGELLSKWPANRISGNPVFVKGDWYGDGTDVLFWHRFRMNDSGKGELYFPDHVYHMFDYTGNGAEEVITRQGGALRVYGYSGAPDGDPLRNPDYLKNNVANHSHYSP